MRNRGYYEHELSYYGYLLVLLSKDMYIYYLSIYLSIS